MALKLGLLPVQLPVEFPAQLPVEPRTDGPRFIPGRLTLVSR